MGYRLAYTTIGGIAMLFRNRSTRINADAGRSYVCPWEKALLISTEYSLDFVPHLQGHIEPQYRQTNVYWDGKHSRSSQLFFDSAEPELFFENCPRTMLSKASTAGLSRLGFNPMSIDVQCRERTFL